MVVWGLSRDYARRNHEVKPTTTEGVTVLVEAVARTTVVAEGLKRGIMILKLVISWFY